MNEFCDLINHVSRIPVHNRTRSSDITNMTPSVQTVNWDLFRSRFGNIKPYDDNPINVNKFIIRGEEHVAIHQHLNDTEFDKHVL